MKYKILAVEWRSGRHTVGFVAYDTQNPTAPGEWNSVVGYVPAILPITFPNTEESDIVAFGVGGMSEQADAQYIAAHGAKIEWNVARELFPQLDITKHKYYG